MKISFPKYCPGELLTRKQGAARIISFVAIAFFAGVCGSYLLGNKLWLLTIALIGIAGILLCLGGAACIFLNCSKVDEAPNANSAPSSNIRENVPRITSQWDYRARASRAFAVSDSPSAETSDVLSPDPFVITDNVCFNFTNPEATEISPLSGDVCRISRYD